GLESDAYKAQHAPLVIEAASLRALALSGSGNLEEATRISRRASRMARTESIPQQEYFANLVLARLRRLNGQTHLATRILQSLLRMASPLWRPWLGWELVMAGAEELEKSLTDVFECREAPFQSLLAACEAAERGERQRLNELAEVLLRTIDP